MTAFRVAGSLFEEVHVQEVRDLVDPADVRAVFFEGELFLIARGIPGQLVRVAPVASKPGAAPRLGYFLRNPLALEAQLEALRGNALPRPAVGSVPRAQDMIVA